LWAWNYVVRTLLCNILKETANRIFEGQIPLNAETYNFLSVGTERILYNRSARYDSRSLPTHWHLAVYKTADGRTRPLTLAVIPYDIARRGRSHEQRESTVYAVTDMGERLHLRQHDSPGHSRPTAWARVP
jgi:hypothetical protein